ncbi:MAG: LTA synthase family protein [Clostridiales bacterium]|nr:LTA synthase family protein [Clostridiales bacterium]
MTGMVFATAPDFIGHIVRNAYRSPAVILLQFMAVLIAVFFLYFVSGRVWVPALAVSFLLFTMCIIHRYKVFLRGDPFLPSDILLSGEALSISSSSAIELGAGVIIMLIAIIAANAAIIAFARFPRPRLPARLAGSILFAALAALSYRAVYTNDAVYNSIKVDLNAYNMVNEFNSRGFLTAFIYHTKELSISKPKGYSEGAAVAILARYGAAGGESGTVGAGGESADSGGNGGGAGTAGGEGGESAAEGSNAGVADGESTTGSGTVGGESGAGSGGAGGESADSGGNGGGAGTAGSEGGESAAEGSNAGVADGESAAGGAPAGGQFLPDVIMIMSEAFWDITQIPALEFTGDTDPLKNFHRLQGESISGDLYTSVFGGGTDVTEFSVLTGHSIANFGADMPSAYKILIRDDTDSVARAFKRAGYSAVAMHPGFSWFYNRANVYRWLGFDRFIHSGDFGDGDISGNYISDKAMADRLMETYLEYTDGGVGAGGDGRGGNPFFNFTVTIQNHGPYDGGWMYGKIPPNYATAPGTELSEKSVYALTNYVRGLQDADEALGRLADFFERSERPVVMAYFGDHLPSLGYNFQAYKELGYPIGYGSEAGLDLQAKLNTYRETYFIWANARARAQWGAYEGLAGAERGQMSANYFGFYLLDKLGIASGQYQSLVMDLYGRLPVYGRFFSSTQSQSGAGFSEAQPGQEPQTAGQAEQEGQGPQSAEQPGQEGQGAAQPAQEPLADMLDDYKIAQHYKMFGEDIDVESADAN